MTSFHSLGQDNWNEVQLGHAMSLALMSESHDADGIINGTISFLMSKWLKWGAAWLLGHVLPLVLTWEAYDTNSIVNGITAFARSRWLKYSTTLPFWSCHANDTDFGITWCHQHWQRNHYILYIKTIKMRSNITFWSCDTIAIAIAITLCHWFWCHMSHNAPL